MNKKLASSKQQDCLQCDSLTCLPVEVLCQILQRVDGVSLGKLECVCRRFRDKLQKQSVNICELAAQRKLVRICGKARAGRWWQHKWQERLHIESQFTGFDPEGWQLGFQYATTPCSPIGVQKIYLTNSGPRLLVSDFSSLNNRILRWRFKVEGEKPSLEIGVVPIALQRFQEALHKAYLHMGCVCEVATGIKSQPTENSHLQYQAAMDSGCIVEIIARKGFMEIRVDPPDCHSNCDQSYFDNVQQRCQHFEVRFPQCYDVKLAATCWPNTRLEVLYQDYVG